MISHYCYFKDGFKYQPYVCNACYDFSMTVQNLSYFFAVTIKNVDYRVYITGVDKKAAVFILKSSDLRNKGISQMDFGPKLVLLKSLKKVLLVVLVLETVALV